MQFFKQLQEKQSKMKKDNTQTDLAYHTNMSIDSNASAQTSNKKKKKRNEIRPIPEEIDNNSGGSATYQKPGLFKR